MALTKLTSELVRLNGGSSLQESVDALRLANIAALRTVDPTYDGQMFYIKCHTHSGYGGGFFRYEADSTLVDDGGWCVVTASGKRLLRITDTTQMNLQDFGAAPGLGIYCDDAFDNMLLSTSQFGVFKCVLPHGRDPSVSYRFNRAHQWYADVTPLRFIGEEVRVSEGVRIAQDYSGVLFTIQNSGTTHFMASLIQGFRFASTLGNTSGVRAIKVSDSWRYCIRDCFFRNYFATAPIHVFNENSWTESVTLERIETRSCKGMAVFTRNGTPGATATDSFFHLRVVDCNFQADQGNSIGLQFGDGTNPVKVYSVDLEIGGWLEGGGGHSFIRAFDHATVEGFLTLTTDGYAGSNGNDLVPVVKSGRNGFIDLQVRCRNNQASYVDITSSAGTNSTMPWYLAKCNDFPTSTNVDGRNTVWCRGAKIFMKASAGTSLKTYTMWRLQPGRSYRCTLQLSDGTNIFTRSYIASCTGLNNLADVTLENKTNHTAEMYCRVLGGGTGGASDPNNGLKFDIIIDGTKPEVANRTVYIELEML